MTTDITECRATVCAECGGEVHPMTLVCAGCGRDHAEVVAHGDAAVYNGGEVTPQGPAEQSQRQ
jgi:uncharacterized OB-fold protein